MGRGVFWRRLAWVGGWSLGGLLAGGGGGDRVGGGDGFGEGVVRGLGGGGGFFDGLLLGFHRGGGGLEGVGRGFQLLLDLGHALAGGLLLAFLGILKGDAGLDLLLAEVGDFI